MKIEFTIREDSFSEIRRSTLKLAIPMLILLAVLPMIIGLSIWSNGFTTNLETVLIIVPTLILILFLAIFTGMKRAKKQFESFKLIIDKDQIIRRQLYVKVKQISIPINEVKSITNNKKGGITIKGKSDSPLQIIFVPKQIQSFEKLKKRLSEILPIK
ncbi:hypothetical protein DZC78_02680 [Olleya aquimaris]|nr:hypothetical protein DZC78_02680 [Olleya aquimaris]